MSAQGLSRDAALRIGLGGHSDLRLVFSRGVARPDPQDIVQALSYDASTTPEPVTLGNTNLKPEHANNYDLLYERYLKPLGLIQAGYFYKDLTDPIAQFTHTTTIQPNPALPTATSYQVTQAGNAGSAHVQGFEIGFQQHLTYLPGVMRGLGISANYSYTESTTDGLPGRSDHPALLRQAPNTWNISPTFDTRKFSMRVGMTYDGAMIYEYQWTDAADSIAPHGPVGDNYLYSHFQVDVQGSYNIAHGIQVYAYGLNLNNEVFGFYNGSPQYVVQREYYKPTYAGGVRYTFGEK